MEKGIYCVRLLTETLFVWSAKIDWKWSQIDCSALNLIKCYSRILRQWRQTTTSVFLPLLGHMPHNILNFVLNHTISRLTILSSVSDEGTSLLSATEGNTSGVLSDTEVRSSDNRGKSWYDDGARTTPLPSPSQLEAVGIREINNTHQSTELRDINAQTHISHINQETTIGDNESNSNIASSPNRYSAKPTALQDPKFILGDQKQNKKPLRSRFLRPTDFSSVMAEQQERQTHVANVCAQSDRPRWLQDVQNMFHLIDDQFNLVYCFIPKAASSSLKRLFWNAHGLQFSDSDPMVHSRGYMMDNGNFTFGSTPGVNLTDKLTQYDSFMFARHPFSRVVSAYLEKFVKFNPAYAKRYGCKIIKLFRANYTERDLRFCNDTTFPEYIKWLILQGQRGSLIDPHWKPFTRLCNPCAAHYDFIGKVETIETDTAYLMNAYFNLPPSEFPHSNSMPHKSYEYYMNHISPEDKYRLYEIYKWDFELFGYNIDW